jgi:hypothetical protein
MAYEQKPGQGILFVNDKKGNEKSPDRKGNALIACPHCQETFTANIAGWLKEGKKGPFLSLKVEAKEKDDGEKYRDKEPARNVENDEIPF